jgi:ABC-type transport system substrate-binding protein
VSTSTSAGRHGHVRPVLLLASAAAAIVLLAACGSDDDGGTGTEVGDGDDEVVVGAQSPITVATEGDPQPGGRLVYALEAESDGWNPSTNRWAVSGVQVAMAVFDPLAALDEQGAAQPYLAQSIEHREDYLQWTIRLRAGVTFHNGTPLDATAVKANLDAIDASALTGAAVQPIESVEVVDDLTVQVNMSSPWVVFPLVLTGQAGVVVEPANLTSGDADRAPVGTGPFTFTSWTPDSELVVARNPSYWRTGLPYLDEVEFRVVPDAQTRTAGMQSGDYDMMYTASTENILEFRQLASEGQYQVVEDQSEPEEVFVLLNTTRPPLDDPRIRQALAHATNQDQVIDVTGGSLYAPARGPYPESSPWYAETEYPAYDPEQARMLVDDYIAEHGELPPFTLTTTPVNENLRTTELLAQQWGEVGINVQLDSVDQATLILNAVSNDFDANLWRQYNAPDPDLEWHWWHESNANGKGGISLNFMQLRDDELSAALDEGRANPDPDDRQEAYATVQQRQAEDVAQIWLYHTIVAVVADNDVRGITNGPLPDGQPSMPMGGTFNGATRLTQTWIAA